MSLEDQIGALAERIAGEIKTKVSTSQVVYGSNGLEGGGALNGADVVITLADAAIGTRHLRPDIFGDAAGSVCEGDDTRLSDARTPTSHTHAQSDVTGLAAALALLAPLASPGLTGTPTAPTATAGTATTQIATTAFVATAVAALVASAPGLLDTLDELAAALGDDANFAATMTTALAGKVGTGRTVSTGTGLTGGGDLSANRTLAVAYGTSSSTACVGNDARLSDTRTPTVGTSPYDLSLIAFGKDTTRAAGTGDNPFGVKLQRATTFTSATFRCAIADSSGSGVYKCQKNGADVSGMTATVAFGSQVAGGTVTGSWAFAAGDILTLVDVSNGGTPGKGLIVDLLGTA